MASRVRREVENLFVWADANWKALTCIFWIGICAYFLSVRWEQIHWFALGDTDDNIRYLQVRDWLNGQGWYDLSQHRLNPPTGANIHWSRICDLPIAGLMLFFRLFTTPGMADRLACGIAPLLPLLPLMLALAFITRRLSNGPAWIIAAFGPLGAPMGMGMFVPLRIDHHGWQLALTVTMLAGIVDRKWLRGGVVAGIASVLSIAIGMEMMVYLAGAGGIIALRWVFKEGAARRMQPYALALGGGTCAAYLAFASYANQQMVCDALSPIWVAVLTATAGGMMVLTLLPLRGWQQRLAAGAVVGAVVGAFGWLNWPQCFTGAYQLSPELVRSWMVYIREAKPITSESASNAVPMLALPVFGALGSLVACWTVRRDAERLWAWASVALMTIFALGLMFWQIRAAPAAQLLSIPAAAWAAYGAFMAIIKQRAPVKLLGVVAILLVTAVLWADPVYKYGNRVFTSMTGTVTPPTPAAKRRAAFLARINKANARCRTLPALAALNKLPPATIFTVVDLGPRLIATTHHSAISGPYHRNGDAILDIHHAFDGPPDGFRAIAARHHAAYFLFCPDFPEGTVYTSRSPKGFYTQIAQGKVPPWLHPVDLPNAAILPYKLYSIDYGSAPVGKKSAQ
ncbi:MAG: hypothetical protein ABI395_02810 [Sphingobium sp.]